ncbi:RIP metalloprotease RseP [Alphaproteobacteria bacterium]|nr:RIP metalloprotease RseP [Alphaproteobacteria bacterium]
MVPFVFVLTIVVFFHELGHFWVARRCGVSVETFSIGFGRSLLRWKDRHGTDWQIGWIPLGGYVKFSGDENAASVPDSEKLHSMSDDDRGKSLHFKPLWQRVAVVSAGPIANFILAIVIFSALFMSFGQQIVRPIIAQVIEDSAAARAGFTAGDRIIAIDGNQVDGFNDVQRVVTVNADQNLTFTIERGNALMDIVATPERVLERDRFGNEFKIGRLGVSAAASSDSVTMRKFGPIDAVVKATEETYFIIEQTFVMIGRIITGRESVDVLGGPIKIAQISGQTATLGLIALIHLTAVISVSIGLINLFPIPMLDGGHLMFYAYEGVFGKPMSQRVQDIGMRVGLGMVLTLFVFVTWNDLSQLGIFG